MKKIFLLLLFLVPYLINAAHYQRVYFDSSSQSLDTNTGTNYFYIYSNSIVYDYIYIYLSDESYRLQNIKYCVTTYSPTSLDHLVVIIVL